MKKLFRLFTCAAAGLAAVAFTGCKDDKPAAPSEIIISGDVAVAVTKAGGPQTITFSANYDWNAKATLTPAGDWCTITPTSGKAGAVCTITVTVGANSGETARIAAVAIATVKEPALAKEVKFTQAANTDPKDVTVKIDDTYSLIFHDRNLGATKVGELGSYLNYADALKACPSGYHLMTPDEYMDLTYYNDIFPNKEALKAGALKMPITGGYKEGTALKEEAIGYYWVDGADWGVNPTDAEVYAVETRNDKLGYLLPPSYPEYKSAWLMQVRCVKDAAP